MPSTAEISAIPIVVAGDVCIDWFAVPIPRVSGLQGPPPRQPANWQLRDGLRMFARPGGAWLLSELVAKTTGQPIIGPPIPSPIEHQDCESALHSMVELGAFPPTSAKDDRRKPDAFVWRVQRFRGFSGGAAVSRQTDAKPVDSGVEGVRLVVLDDVGNGFRDHESGWPKALQGGGDGPLVLWKLIPPFRDGVLSSYLLRLHAARTIVVLDVDHLRAEGAAISRQLSWERTAGDVIHALTHDPSFATLRKAGHLIVRLGQEGAVHVANLGSKGAEVELTYLPGGIEGSTRAEVPGEMLGFSSMFVAVLAGELVRPGAASVAAAIRAGVQCGLAASARLFRTGFGPSSFEPIALPSLVPGCAAADSKFVTLSVAPLAGHDPTSRLFDYVRKLPLERLAEGILELGIGPTIAQAPVARFGDLETLDRTEIETYRSIRNLIGEYLAQPNPERPLSIAVFGPPGSGKSFGVAQVAKSLGDVEKIEFNVSQFENARQLTAAFHVVRDAVVRGRVPLVFFDEFDAAANRPLPWLKHFLSPMQDGKFMDGESTHMIGRAVFVFAGGTKHTFEAFARLGHDEFIDAKGPDFVSRLRGVIDIRGTDRREPNDAMYVIRRAVLLESMLKRKTPALFDAAGLLRIDAGVRRAFLRCGSFLHGARSMESIIDMSLLAGRETFERASLPPQPQLSLHVDAQEFMELVTQDVRLGEQRERLGKAIHRRFVAQQRGSKGRNDPSMRPWGTLPENYREDNRQQADDTLRKLTLIGCGLRPANDGDGRAKVTLSAAEVELLAEAEHERWKDSKRMQGYTYAPGKKNDDDKVRTHPCLLPWSDLSEVEKQKDRDTVRQIPKFMASMGFHAFRLT